MCAFIDKEATKEFKAKFRKKGQTWFWGYKIVTGDNRAQIAFPPYYYEVGVNYAKTTTGRRWRGKRYDTSDPRGIHVCCGPQIRRILLKDYGNLVGIHKVIKVKCYLRDLLGVENGYHFTSPYRQAVLRKVTVPTLEGIKK